MANDAPRALVQRASARVGAVLKGKWRLDGLLGIGGTACVYAATHRNGKRVAVKILHPEYASNEQLVARFLREGYVANRLEHPGAVAVLDDDTAEDGSVFLVMELLDGYSLDRHTKRDAERLPLATVLRIADESLDVLAIAHAKGIVHRDIKPANLFMTTEGRVKVLDFGIARLAQPVADGSATQTGAAIGTPAFMPPEQARGRWDQVDARTDIWSIGATMWALITGDRPRRAETVQEELLLAMTAPVPPLSTVAPQVPPPVAAVIDRALAFDQNERWPDARTMQRALRDVLDAGHARIDDGSFPTNPRQDTAPALVGVPPSHPAEMGSTQLSTGRPILWTRSNPNPMPARKSSVPLLLTFAGAFAVVFGVVAAAGVVVLKRAKRGVPAAAAAASVATEAPVASTTPVAIAPPPVETASSAPAPPESASAAASASAAPTASAASAPPRAPTPPPARPPPATPPAPTSTNILNERF